MGAVSLRRWLMKNVNGCIFRYYSSREACSPQRKTFGDLSSSQPYFEER